MGKAIFGALMGLGQGISQYGGMLGYQEMERQRQAEEFSRQRSLEEIREKYAQTVRLEQRTYDEGQKAEGRTYAEGQKTDDRDYAERRALAAYQEGTPEFEARKLGEASELEFQKKLITARADAGGYGHDGRATSAIINTEYYKSLSPEQKEVFDRVNKISDIGALTEKDVSAAAIKLYTSFAAKESYEKEDELKFLGLDPELEGKALQAALIAKYKETIHAFSPPASEPAAPRPLMGVGAPSSGPDNPVAPSIPPSAIELLLKDPSLKYQFDAKYGVGAADRILGG